MTYHPIVEVLSSEVSVTGRCLHFKDAVFDCQNGDVECSTAQVEDEHIALALALLVQPIGNGSGGWLVDDAENIQSRDGPGVLGGLTLAVVEISRHRDDCILDGLSQKSLGGLLHLDQNHGRDFLQIVKLIKFQQLEKNLREEGLRLALDLHLDFWTSALALDHFERPVFHVRLHGRVIEFATDQALGV